MLYWLCHPIDKVQHNSVFCCCLNKYSTAIHHFAYLWWVTKHNLHVVYPQTALFIYFLCCCFQYVLLPDQNGYNGCFFFFLFIQKVILHATIPGNVFLTFITPIPVPVQTQEWMKSLTKLETINLLIRVLNPWKVPEMMKILQVSLLFWKQVGSWIYFHLVTPLSCNMLHGLFLHGSIKWCSAQPHWLAEQTSSALAWTDFLSCCPLRPSFACDSRVLSEQHFWPIMRHRVSVHVDLVVVLCVWILLFSVIIQESNRSSGVGWLSSQKSPSGCKRYSKGDILLQKPPCKKSKQYTST